jgi:hypothetical protein
VGLGAGNGDGKQDGDGLRTVAAEAVEEKVDAWTYVFGKPGELDRDLAQILECTHGVFMQQVCKGADFLRISARRAWARHASASCASTSSHCSLPWRPTSSA